MSLITLKTIPGASKNEVVGWENINGKRILKVKVTAAPEKGKANKALLDLLAAHFQCSKAEIALIRGATNRLKTFRIQSIKDKL